MDPNAEIQQPAAAAPETDLSVPEAVETPATDKLDAFSAGVEEARAEEAADPAAASVPDAAADPAAVVEGEPDPAAVADPAQPAAVETPKDQPGQEPAAKTVDDEIKELGITNERTQQRFRELSQRTSEATEQLRTATARADEWEQTVASTGASPQQFGNALQYLAAINSGNPEQMAAAFDSMQQELAWLGKKIGREAPGFDPLSEHPDLAEKVASGDLTREVAAELVQSRQRGVLHTEQQQTQQQRQQAQAAEQQGLHSVAALGQRLQADPQFQQKFAFLTPTIEIIQSTMPPAQWAAAIEQAYQRLPVIPAPAPVAVARPNNPARASAAAAVPATPKNPSDAFSFGVAEAQAAGR